MRFGLTKKMKSLSPIETAERIRVFSLNSFRHISVIQNLGAYGLEFVRGRRGLTLRNYSRRTPESAYEERFQQ